MTRDERQAIAKDKWLKSNGIGTLVQPTGCGKTITALKCLKTVLTAYPNLSILVVVPTSTLKDQWKSQLDSWGLGLNAEVEIINTVVKRNNYKADILVLDEVHRYAASTFLKVFEAVSYRFVLGLTATFDRLDGKHEIIAKYCPVVDMITSTEALANQWVSEYKEYLVLIDVDNIEEYQKWNKEFQIHFEYLNFDFNLAMSLLGPTGFINRAKLRDQRCPNGTEAERKEVFKQITYHATAFMRCIQQRKAFVNNHPKKLELTRKIINARPFSKVITFSNNIKMAEAIGIGKVYSGKDTKKKGRLTMEEFANGDFQVINTIQKCNEGMDLKGLSVAVILGLDSSKTKAVQRLGRIIRKENDKEAEAFNLVINNTIETKWFENSHNGANYITIDEEGLDAVLRGEEPSPYTKKLKDFQFRY